MPSSLQLHRINPTNLTTIGNFSKPFTPPETSITRRTITFCENNNIQIPDSVACHHSYMVKPNQCCSAVVQTIRAPAETVWSVVRRFDNPHAYKHFLKSCEVVTGDGNVGTVREVHVVSGLPAESSMERLEVLDDEKHVLSFKIVGGDHRLANYQSVTTLHCEGNDHESSTTVVVESYVVDVPAGNTCEETCVFVDTIVRCNLQSLAQMAENIARKNQNEL